MKKTSTKVEQILSTARKLFTKYGYKRVSMDEIAKNANVVKSTIYQYFDDKDELLNYFIYETINEMKDMVENIEKNSKSTFEMIHKTIYELLMYREKQQLLATIAKEAEDFHNAKLIESLQMVDQSILDYIESKLKIGMEKNVIKKCNSKIMAFVLFKSYTALVNDWEKENEPLNEEEIADNISLFFKNRIIS